MLDGSQLQTAIAAVLIGAVLIGILLHWLWSRLWRPNASNSVQLDAMAMRLHEADLSREEAEEARETAKALLARRDAETAERLAEMQARVDGAFVGREAELAGELEATRLELETMHDGLVNARRRIIELEAKIEALSGNAD